MLRTAPVTQGTLGQYSPTNEGLGHSSWVTGSAARERPMGLHRQTASVLQDDGRVGTSRLGTSEMRLASPLLGGWAECPASWVRGGLEPGSALLASVNKQTNKQTTSKQANKPAERNPPFPVPPRTPKAFAPSRSPGAERDGKGRDCGSRTQDCPTVTQRPGAAEARGLGPPRTLMNQEPLPFVSFWKVLESQRGPGLFLTVGALCSSRK